MDVSGNVSANAVGVLLHLHNTNTTDRQVGLRKNGSTDNNKGYRGDIESTSHYWQFIGVDASKIFEFWHELTAGEQKIFLVGEVDSDFVFNTNGIAHTPTVASTWTDVDISTDTGADTAIGVLLHFNSINTSVSNSITFGARQNGSTDNITRLVEAHCMACVGVDGSEIAEAFVDDTAGDVLHIGYIKTGATFNLNGIDRSISTLDTWVNLAALPAGAIGGIYEIHTGGTARLYGLRKGGTTENIVARAVKNHNWAMVECDTSQICEGQIDNTIMDFVEIGFFSASGGGGGGPVAGLRTLSLSGVGI